MTKKINIRNWIYSFIYFFRQAAKLLSLKFKNINNATFGGNLDPYYLLGICNFHNILKSKKALKKFLLLVLPLFMIFIIQLVVLNDINYIKGFVNIFKIIVCISIMLYIKNKKIRINLLDICKKITILLIIFTIISFIFKDNSVLWRLNDYTNGYDLRRLQLFYLEPSELGFHISILIIVLFSFYINSNNNNKNLTLILIIANIIILYFSKSMGAILILIAAILAMMISNALISKSKNIIFKYLCVAIVSAVGIIIFLSGDSGMSNRIKNTLAGKDNSVNYRVNVSLNVLNQSLKDYNYIGCGFGNLNTSKFISKYQNLKLDQMIVNSFVYFWVETGLIGIIYWLFLMIYIIKKVLKSKSIIKIGLFAYIFLFQFVGSHFTNGIIWLIYGFIISENDDNSLLSDN